MSRKSDSNIIMIMPTISPTDVYNLELLQRFDHIQLKFYLLLISPLCNMQLSIIVCVYNSSKYLAECLCSICKQLESQHELIIINDNSSDNSESIISSFSDAHHNIVSISNNNNIGAGASRNIGLKHARGKYITFIDSDDYIGEGYFTSLINDIETNKTEIVFSDYKYIDKDSHFHQASVFTQNNKVIWRKMVASAWTAPWAKLYRSDFIHKYNLHFNTQSSIGEDIQFSWLSYIYCKKAMISDHACYYYSQNQNGCDHITDERVFGIIKALNTTKKIYNLVTPLKRMMIYYFTC